MRIIHIVHGKVNPNGHNGISRVVYHLNRQERAQGINSEIWSLVDDAKTHFSYIRDNYVTVECFPRVRIPYVQHEIIKRLISEKNSIDLVHFHMIWFFDKNIIARATTRAAIPYIITTHGTYSKPNATAGKKRLARMLFERAYLNGAVEIHAITNEESQKLKDYGYNGPTFIAPNGIDLSEIPEVRRNDVFDVLPKPEIARFIWIGVKRSDKNLVELIYAVEMLPRKIRDNLVIYLIGPNYRNNESEYKALVNKLGIVKNFSFVGPLYGKEKYDALESADVHILPSLSEVFSLAMLDAMACSKPCLVSKGCGYGPWEDDDCFISFDPTAEAIADAIKQMFVRRMDWQRMGENARKVIKRDLNWPTIARIMIENYVRILKK
tara:strand:- start:8431 stop:9570 length:1140 start_codon:yes stop_codon:yes gene_type:complete